MDNESTPKANSAKAFWTKHKTAILATTTVVSTLAATVGFYAARNWSHAFEAAAPEAYHEFVNSFSED